MGPGVSEYTYICGYMYEIFKSQLWFSSPIENSAIIIKKEKKYSALKSFPIPIPSISTEAFFSYTLYVQSL